MAGTVTTWLKRMKDGDSRAVSRLWNYFAPQMKRSTAAECRKLKASDEDDIVSMAFFNLTSAVLENRAEGITNRKEFWRLLKAITKRRLHDTYRRENARIRGGGRKFFPIQPSDRFLIDEDHEQVVMDEDTLLSMLQEVASRMERPEYEKIIECKVRGMTNAEVARTINMSLRTTQYLIKEIKDAWLKTFDEV